MLIPLDYYRILGLPIQADTGPEVLDRARQERLARSPRPEYSQGVISARNALIAEAHRVLSDPAERLAYDAAFLSSRTTAASSGSVPWRSTAGPGLDLEERQIVAALVLLQELGEYEATIELGYPYLNQPAAIESGRLGEPRLVTADVVLALVLAYWELGREQWQHNHSESAAGSLKIAQELLLHHGLFSGLRGEIQADLYKLRPYRIVEGLGAADPEAAERRAALQLLRDMLKERQGLDGKGNDRSGLNTEDFLRFVQQVRSRLGAGEQLSLFEAEARRPSAVATYLAAYAAIAQGFSQQQPALVQRASLLLRRLGTRQDVYLEQAVCGLLLGKPEEAQRSLELSRDRDPLAAIRAYAPGSPDLLPGLCAYSEHWLQTEVYPHFRDLSGRRASLTDYFGDPGVQLYLETLTDDDLPSEPSWAIVPHLPQSAPAARPPGRSLVSLSSLSPAFTSAPTRAADRPSDPALAGWGAVGGGVALAEPPPAGLANPPEDRFYGADEAATDGAADRPPLMRPVFTGLLGERSPVPSRRPSLTVPQFSSAGAGSGAYAPSTPPSDPEVDQPARGPLPPAQRDGGRRRPAAPASRARPPRSGRDRWVVLLGLGLVGLTFVGLTLARLDRSGGPLPEGEQPSLRLDRPLIEIPEPAPVSGAAAATGALNPDSAAQLVRAWLSAKAAAMGPERSIDRLAEVLSGEMLTSWQGKARAASTAKATWEYQHRVKLLDLKPDEANPEQAIATAEVKEAATLRDNGRVDKGESYDKTLKVRYTLQRAEGDWKIVAAKVL